MTDRALPYACAVANRAIDALATQGNVALAGEVAVVNRATCDLVHALHREHEAITPAAQFEARQARQHAEAVLRGATDQAAAYDAASDAAIAHLQALLASRRKLQAARRRHAGFLPEPQA